MREDSNGRHKVWLSEVTSIVDSGKSTTGTVTGTTVLAFLEKGVGGRNCKEEV